MPNPIRILLVDDHSLFRESLSRLLEAEPDFSMVASCATVAEALRVLDSEPADIVLLDYDLGEEQGIGFLVSTRERGHICRILMVTAGMSDAITVESFRLGATGIFLKHSPPAQLVEAIHKVAAGEMWLDPRAVPALISGVSAKQGTHTPENSLSPREKAVLKGVFEGLTNKEIAGDLQLSESSVKAVLQQLFEKTGVRTRSQLVRIAIERHSADWLAD